MRQQFKTLIQNVIRNLGHTFSLSFSQSLILQLISNIQIIYLIISPTVYSHSSLNLKLLRVIRYASSLTAGPGLFETNPSQKLALAFWALCTFYLFVLLVLAFLLIRKSRNFQPHSQITKITKLIYQLHAKVIFLPIHYFLIWFALSYNKWGETTPALPKEVKTCLFAFTIFFCVLNVGIAVLKEAFIFRVARTEDTFASKNNMYYQVAVCHKIIVSSLTLTLDGPTMLIYVISLVLSLFSYYSVLVQLPFYNLTVLKAHMIYSTCHLTFSLILTSTSNKNLAEYSEILILLVTVFAIIVSYEYLNSVLLRIFRLDFRTSYEAIHIQVLLDEYTNNYSTLLPLNSKSAKRGSLYLYGLFRKNHIDTLALPGENSVFECNQQLYHIIIQKLKKLSKKYSNSSTLELLQAKIYAKKIGNTSNALIHLSQLKNNKNSIQLNNAIEDLFNEIQQYYSKEYSNEELQIFSQFMYLEKADKFRETILLELNKHINIWEELSQQKINVKKISDLSWEIDKLHHLLNKSWKEISQVLDKSFPSLYLIYFLYCDIILNKSESKLESIKNNYELSKKKGTFPKDFNIFSDKTAVILASIENDTLGIITDASNSVQNLFDIPKKSLIGQKIDVLLPRAIAQNHDKVIIGSNQKGAPPNTTIETYAKTLDDYFFPVELKHSIYPYISKGLNLITQIKKIKNRELLVIVNSEEKIVDCSQELFEVFNLTKKDLDYTSINEICPTFHEIHLAFNIDSDHFQNEMLSPEESQVDKDDISSEDPKIQNTQFRNSPSEPHETGIETYRSTKIPFLDHQDSDINSLGHTDRSNYNASAPTHGKDLYKQSKFAKESLLLQTSKSRREELCNQLKNGIELVFYALQKNNNRNQDMVREALNFKVVIDSLELNEKFYKIIKFKKFLPNFEKEMKDDQSPLKLEDSVNIKKNIILLKELTPKTSRSMTIIKSQGDSKLVKPSRFYTTKKIHGIFDQHDQDSDEFNHFHKADQNGEMENFRKVDLNQESVSSLSTFQYRGTKIASALEALYQKKRLRRVTKTSVFILYLAAIVVVCLFSLNYFFSSMSLNTIKQGAVILNDNGVRIFDLTLLWQSALAVYSRATGFRKSLAQVPTNQKFILDYTRDLLNQDEKIQGSLQEIGNIELMNTYFSLDIEIWDYHKDNTINNGLINAFTANKILVNKYLLIANWNRSITLLNNNLDALLALNNSCNDVLIIEENQMTKTAEIIEGIGKDNATLLDYLLILEIMAEIFVGISLILISKVVLQSYKKLFGVLTNIKQSSISKRIAELSALKKCLQQNIESKEFQDEAEAFFEKTKKNFKAKSLDNEISSGNSNRRQHNSYVIKEFVLQLMKSLVGGQILVIIMIVLFIISFFKYNIAFDDLQVMTRRISLTHKIASLNNLVMGNFYYLTMFYNDTQFLFKNSPPLLQQEQILSYLSNANNLILKEFTDHEKGIFDPTIQKLLQNTVCSFYVNNNTVNSQAHCELATQGKLLGLLGLNDKIYQTHEFYFNLFLKNPTLENAKTVFDAYSLDSVSSMSASKNGYDFLKGYLFDLFIEQAKKEIIDSKVRFILYLLALVISPILIQVFSINKFQKFDIGIRKILKVISMNLIIHNKNFGFYLKNEFKKELEEVRQFI